MTSVLYPEAFNTISQNDRSYRGDDSGGEVFRNIPKNSSTFRIWKIEVTIIFSFVETLSLQYLLQSKGKKKIVCIYYFYLSCRVYARQLSPEATWATSSPNRRTSSTLCQRRTALFPIRECRYFYFHCTMLRRRKRNYWNAFGIYFSRRLFPVEFNSAYSSNYSHSKNCTLAR